MDKASAGALEYVPVVRVSNITSCVKELRDRGVWVYAAAADGRRCDRSDLSGAVALVIGSEGQGVSRLVRENCDDTLAIPMKGKIGSLNASVAAGILMYEIMKQRAD